MEENRNKVDFRKVYAALTSYYEGVYPFMFEILNASTYVLEDITVYRAYLSKPDFAFILYVQPNVFIKYTESLDTIENRLEIEFEKFSDLNIKEIKIKLDYSKYQIVESVVRPVLTDWEEININQNALIEQLS